MRERRRRKTDRDLWLSGEDTRTVKIFRVTRKEMASRRVRVPKGRLQMVRSKESAC